jgi:gamma-glutamyltranspeptidase/glutathione hydrolase
LKAAFHSCLTAAELNHLGRAAPAALDFMRPSIPPILRLLLASLLLFALPCLRCHAAALPSETATRGFVAAGHPLATQAGLDVLEAGGNAVDAAVAIGLTLGVVDGANSGLGGGCFILLRLADGRCVAIDGRETAPAAASRDMFVREGRGDPRLSQTGALASGVPGALAAYEHARGQHGTRTLRELILPAAAIAERGFVLSARQSKRIQQVAADLARFPATRSIFLLASNQPPPAGHTLRQTDLAATYRALAEHGPAWFYGGPFAERTALWMQANGGLLTIQDFRDYRPKLREPLVTTYRKWTIVGFPPPSSGGVHVAQILNVLEQFELPALAPADRLHVLAEAMKAAFADRAWWLGDPDFTRVPRGLVDKRYAQELAARISLERARPVAGHGTPPGWGTDCFERHTTHFSVADAAGNWVACTATVNTTYGSKVVIPGTGVVLNNELDDFSIQPGVTNYFGLIGAEANAVAPGKRPLSSMSPTIVLAGGQPIAALGAAGGPMIITATVQNLVNLLDLGLPPAAALASPRVHQQWLPDELLVEPELPADVRAGLKRRGHRVKTDPGLGVAQVVTRTPDRKAFTGAADPRGAGTAAGR